MTLRKQVVFPIVAELNRGGFYAFVFFTVPMVFQLIFVVKVMPETKGKSLEDLGKELSQPSSPVQKGNI